MSRYLTYPLAALTAAVAMLAAAPFAGAQATCQEAGGLVRCETNGSVSIKSVPGTRAPNVADQIPRNNNRSGIVLTW
jgi:hypothetical protein